MDLTSSRSSWFAPGLRTKTAPEFVGLFELNLRNVQKAAYDESGEDVRLKWPETGSRWSSLRERRSWFVRECQEKMEESFDKLYEHFAEKKGLSQGWYMYLMPTMKTPSLRKYQARVQQMQGDAENKVEPVPSKPLSLEEASKPDDEVTTESLISSGATESTSTCIVDITNTVVQKSTCSCIKKRSVPNKENSHESLPAAPATTNPRRTTRACTRKPQVTTDVVVDDLKATTKRITTRARTKKAEKDSASQGLCRSRIESTTAVASTESERERPDPVSVSKPPTADHEPQSSSTSIYTTSAEADQNPETSELKNPDIPQSRQRESNDTPSMVISPPRIRESTGREPSRRSSLKTLGEVVIVKLQVSSPVIKTSIPPTSLQPMETDDATIGDQTSVPVPVTSDILPAVRRSVRLRKVAPGEVISCTSDTDDESYIRPPPPKRSLLKLKKKGKQGGRKCKKALRNVVEDPVKTESQTSSGESAVVVPSQPKSLASSEEESSALVGIVTEHAHESNEDASATKSQVDVSKQITEKTLPSDVQSSESNETMYELCTEPLLSDSSFEKEEEFLSASQQEEENTQLLGLLVKNFGLTAFMDWQLEAINAVLKGKNTLIIQPTGGGKSLCFCFPPFVTEKVSIVITPTISLMADQVRGLQEKGIRAARLGGGVKDADVLPGLKTGKYQVLFVTPEKFLMTNGMPYQCFLDLSSAGKLGLIAVDEAHLLATWSSFRKSFMHLQQLPRLFPAIPLMALTATATLKTKEMLLEMLGKECACFQASVDRPNIFLEVHELNLPANDPQHGKNIHARMATVLQKHIGQSKAIVYLDFIDDVNSLTIALREKGTHTAAYHGDKMSPHDKAKVIDNWKSGGVQVVVCTKALGLGINQPDVETVVRVGCPQSIEDFVQEFGRAGRDGRPARGILLYCEKDLQHASLWAKEAENSVLASFQESWRFAYSHLVGKCRRQIILQHFGEDTTDVCSRERCCDVCKGLTTTTNMQPEITSILQALKKIPGKGEKKLAEWIRGAYRQNIGLSLLDDDHETYGIGRQFPHTVDRWRIIIRQAWLLGLLDRKMFLGRGEQMACSMVFNTLYPNVTTEEFLRSPSPVAIPTFVDSSRTSHPPVSGSHNPSDKKARQSKGVQALPIIKKLMGSRANWFPIRSAEDYHIPGMFRHPFPQRMGYCQDITSLGHYIASDPDFLFSDIQLGKGKCRGWNDRTMTIGGEEDGSGESLKVRYKIVPCKGVKVCEMYKEGCNYIISTREVRNCPTHPDASLLMIEDCPVDFVYIRPAASDDNRRWLTGIDRLTDMRGENLHTHPFHASSKIPAKVQSDIREAIAIKPQLKTKEVITDSLPQSESSQPKSASKMGFIWIPFGKKGEGSKLTAAGGSTHLPMSFLPRNSPMKQDLFEVQKLVEKVQRKKEDEDQRKRELEAKRQQELQDKIKQREERAKQVAEKQAVLAREEQERRKRMDGQRKKDELFKKEKFHQKKVKEFEQKTEKQKELMQAAEIRRRQEEEQELQRLYQLQEERRMQEELTKKRMEQEEEDKRVHRVERQKAEQERQLQREDEREAEQRRRIEEERLQAKEARHLQEELESKRQQEAVWKQQEYLQKEEEKKKFEKLLHVGGHAKPTVNPTQVGNTANRFIEQWKQLRANANEGTSITATVTKSKNPPSKKYHSPEEPEESIDLMNSTFTIEAKQTVVTPAPNSNKPNYAEVSSYEMTPIQQQDPFSIYENYDIGGLSSDDSTDEEDCPKKVIPPWAHPTELGKLMQSQEKKVDSRVINIHKIFPPDELLLAPDLARIFKHKRKRFYHRSSSARWDSPMLKKSRVI